MTGTAPKVFISYSHDSSEHEDRVLDLADRLRADGVYAEVDQYNTAPPEGWPLWCERQIEAADFVLMVCTESYHRRVTGAEQPGTGLGVVWEAGIIRQLLYDAGGVSNKFIPVLCSDASTSDVPIMIRGRNWYVVDTEDGYELLYRFLSAQPDVARPPPPGPLRPLPVRSRTLKSSLFLAPPRPYGYKIVGRDEIVQDIKTRLFSGRDSAICALNGLPGVGKTALAIELAHDPEIRARFKDGVLWTGLGRDNPDILSHLTKWGVALDIPPEQRANLTGDKEWMDALRRAIGPRQMLLIIDDAWKIENAQPFMLRCDNCVHLLTTRIPEIALAFAGKTTHIPELSDANGLTLLGQFIPEIVDEQQETMQKLERDVGGLPLALILIGKYLRKEASSGQPSRISGAIKKLQSATERLQLSGEQDLLAPHPSLPVGARVSLQTIIYITIKELDEKVRSAFWSMSVFPPKPNTFSDEAACAVSETSTETLNILHDYGLLESSGPGRYTLHQAIEEYAKMHLTDRAAYERMGQFFSNILTPYGKPYVPFKKDILASVDREEENIKASLMWYQEQNKWSDFVPLARGFCSYLGYIGRWQEEIEWGKRAGYAADKSGDKCAQAHVYCHVLPWPMWMRGEYQQARESCRTGIEATQKLNELDGLIYLSLAYHNLYRTALQECQNENDGDVIALRLEEAKSYGEKCLEYAMQTKDSSLFQTLQGLAFSNMGFTALKVGDYQKAEGWFRKRLKLVRRTDNQVQIACRLLDVSLSLVGQKKYPEAESCVKEAQSIAADWKRLDLSAELLFGLAKIKREKGEVTHANELETQARQFWTELGFRRDPFVFILNKPERGGS